MPARAPVYKAPAAVVADSWTGFYIGGHVGGAWTDIDSSVTDVFRTFAFPVQNLSASDSSVIGGAQIGYNWQFAPNWVLGIEADWSWTDLNPGARISPIPATGGGVIAGGSFVSTAADVNWLASLRGRIGYTWDNRWLAYFTGGVAWADVDYSADAQCNPAICVPGSRSPVSFSKTKTGFVVGGGLEYKFVGSQWILGAEYLFYGFDGEGATSPLLNFASGAPLAVGACAAGAACIAHNFGDLDIHVVRARLSYKFGAPY
jgi:outer membrane immunogenic protein